MRGVFLQLAVCAAMAGSAYAQNPNIPRRPLRTDDRIRLEAPAAVQPTAAPQTPPAPRATRKSCTLLISRENASKQLVLDEAGVYQHRVREVYWKTVIGMFNPVIRTRSWDGIFKPASDKIETALWNLKDFRVVEESEFEEVLSGSVSPPAPAASRVAPLLDDPFEE